MEVSIFADAVVVVEDLLVFRIADIVPHINIKFLHLVHLDLALLLSYFLSCSSFLARTSLLAAVIMIITTIF